MVKKLILVFALILAVIIFLRFGRTLYMPVVTMIKGKATVESRIETIEAGVRSRMEQNLNQAGYTDYPQEIILVAFKQEQKLLVYAKEDAGVQLIKEYPFTAYSGELGPKLKEGDKQIPEGVYEVEYLNPNSSYYLSIKVSYPNEFDKLKSTLAVEDMGGDIFIHGKSATIGCVPIGDDAIEEVFVLTQKAINQGVKVIISPKDFRKDDRYPQISSVDWEEELYDTIKMELEKLTINVHN